MPWAAALRCGDAALEGSALGRPPTFSLYSTIAFFVMCPQTGCAGNIGTSSGNINMSDTSGGSGSGGASSGNTFVPSAYASPSGNFNPSGIGAGATRV